MSPASRVDVNLARSLGRSVCDYCGEWLPGESPGPWIEVTARWPRGIRRFEFCSAGCLLKAAPWNLKP